MPFQANNNMPMTLCKITGFGLIDIRENDARIDPTGYAFNHSPYSINELMWYLEDAGCYEMSEYYGPALWEMIHIHQNILCIIPPSHVYCNFSIHPERYPQEPARIIENFAGSSSFMDCRTGKRLPGCLWSLFKRAYDQYIHKCDAERYAEEFELVSMAQTLGFHDIEQAISCAVPEIPKAVRAMCKYLDLFVDANTVNSLRPMTCSYRSKYVPFEITV